MDLQDKNLVDIHQELDEFAQHHRKQGGHDALKLIEKWNIEDNELPKDGSEAGALMTEGWNSAKQKVLQLLREAYG